MRSLILTSYPYKDNVEMFGQFLTRFMTTLGELKFTFLSWMFLSEYHFVTNYLKQSESLLGSRSSCDLSLIKIPGVKFSRLCAPTRKSAKRSDILTMAWFSVIDSSVTSRKKIQILNSKGDILPLFPSPVVRPRSRDCHLWLESFQSFWGQLWSPAPKFLYLVGESLRVS